MLLGRIKSPFSFPHMFKDVPNKEDRRRVKLFYSDVHWEYLKYPKAYSKYTLQFPLTVYEINPFFYINTTPNDNLLFLK